MNNIIIKNGRCMTMDERVKADWIVVEDSVISHIGDGEGYKKFVRPDTRVIDAAGGSVLPGFIDSHFHVVKTAVSKKNTDLSGVSDFQQIGEIIKGAAHEKPGQVIIADGLEVTKIKEGRFPGRTVLDKYCSNVPVAVYSKDLHVLMLNTYGILFYKVPFTLNGVDLDSKGMPTGIFRNQAGARLDTNIMSSFSKDELDESIYRLLPELFSYGLTTVAAMEGGGIKSSFNEDYECEFIYNYGRYYPISMELFYQTTDVERITEMNLERIGGALYLDGTMGVRTAYLSFDYADQPGKRGLSCFNEEYLENFVIQCCENNLQVSLDAIGDSAIEMALTAFEKASKEFHIKDMRHRIEHGELLDTEQMKRAADLGIIISMQPAYEGIWGYPGGMYSHRLGERYGTTNQFREIIDAGGIICGGSDSPVTEPDPILGIHFAVNHPVSKHRISVQEAVKIYTLNGAYGLFCEDKVGSLTPGKRADIVILDNDIETVKPDLIRGIQVNTTIKSGEILFDRCR